jgi:hypothetical protein
VHTYDVAADPACLRVPGHVVADFETGGHSEPSTVGVFFRCLVSHFFYCTTV